MRILVTFIIGNGFDIKTGLKTRYTDFYKVYTKKKTSDSGIIRHFKDVILKSEAHNWTNWADFELQMGIHSKDFSGFTPVEDFIACFNDFVVCFNEYLFAECAKINWNAVGHNLYNTLLGSIQHFDSYITQISQDEIRSLIPHNATVNFLQFNYTDTFDKLLQLGKFSRRLLSNQQNVGNHITRLGDSLHVHGKLGVGGYATMGVDSEAQIKNQKIQCDSRIHTIFIKPKFLDLLQARNVNQKNVREKALSVMNGSNIICTFGTSIGHTDKY